MRWSHSFKDAVSLVDGPETHSLLACLLACYFLFRSGLESNQTDKPTCV